MRSSAARLRAGRLLLFSWFTAAESFALIGSNQISHEDRPGFMTSGSVGSTPLLMMVVAFGLLVAGCAKPGSQLASKDGGFAFEVENAANVTIHGTVNATTAKENPPVSQDYQVPAGQTQRFSLQPPGPRFSFEASLLGSGTAKAQIGQENIDLTTCPGLTVYHFKATGSSTSLGVTDGALRCDR